MIKRAQIVVPVVLCAGLAGILVYRQVQSANAADQVHYRTDVAADGDVTDAVEASGTVQALTMVDLEVPCRRTFN